MLVSYPEPSTLCKAVPTKALPYDLVAGAVTSMFAKGLWTEEQVCSWELYLEVFAQEDAAMCRTCSKIRTDMLNQVESKKDAKEVANAKSRERRALGQQLKLHLRTMITLPIPSCGLDRSRSAGALRGGREGEVREWLGWEGWRHRRE